MASKRQKHKPKPKSTSQPVASAHGRRRPLALRVFLDFVLGLSLTVALVAAKEYAQDEHWTAALYAEDMARQWLQLRLSTNSRHELPVVVDISNFAPTPLQPYTSRSALKKLLQEIIASPSGAPRAIGLDVNFSSTPDRPFFVPTEDPGFFDFCLSARRQVPLLFAGVSTSVALGPDRCLGASRYAALAAYIDHPNTPGFGASHEMDEYVEVPHVSNEGAVEHWRFRSLAAAVTQHPIVAERPGIFRRMFGWMIAEHESFEEPIPQSKETIEHTSFVVDFSRIDEIRSSSVAAGADGSLPSPAPDFSHRLVLVGRVASADESDLFPVPGHTDHYPGVLLHAAAAYTLDKNNLLVLTEKGRRTLDFIFWLAVFGIVAAFKWKPRAGPHEPGHEHGHDLEVRLAWVMVLVIIGFGLIFVNALRIFWDDFILVALATLLHPHLSHWIERAGSSLYTLFRPAHS